MRDTPPSSDSSKDSYSIDEMMERLRATKAGGGPPGKRKRRSAQPVLEERKQKKRWLLFLLIGLLIAGLAILVFHMLNQARVEGEIFRAAANRRFSQALGCEVECDRFRTTGWRDLSCPAIRLKGNSGVFKDGLFTNLRSTLTTSTTFRNEWDIPSLAMDSASLTFQSNSSASHGDDQAAEPSGPVVVSDSFRLGISAEPAFVTASDIRIEQVDFSWPNSKGGMNRIEDLKANGSLSSGVLRLQGSGGRWIGGLWPESRVQNLKMEMGPHYVQIDSARIEISKDAEFRTSGKISFTPEGPSGTLEVKAESMQFQDLFTPAWQKRVYGKFMPKKMSYVIVPGKSDEWSGDFEAEGVVLDGFPGLQTLATFFKNDLYSKMEFRQFSGSFHRTDDVLKIDNILGSREGICRITGSLAVYKDGRLEGKLRLLLNTPAKDLPQFSAEEDGLDVIEITLGGTEAAPEDNLGKLFAAP